MPRSHQTTALLALLLLPLAVLPWGCQSVPKRTYRAIYNQNPPYYYKPLNGTAEGAMIDVFNAAAARAGIQLEWVLWQDAPEDLMKSGRADLLFLAVVTPERQRDFHLTEPWLRIDGQLVWRKQPGSRTAPNLEGKTVGVPGYRLYELMAKRHFSRSHAVRRTSRIELLEMLCRGEIDATIIDSRSAAMYMLDRPAACNNIPLGMDLVEDRVNDIAVMGTRDARAAAESIRGSLSQIARDGTMHRLYKKWGVGFLPEVKQADELGDSRRTTFYLQILLAGLGLLLTIVVLLLFRLRRVARQAGHANAAKSTFLATMSHETRTPLNGIIGLAEALEEEPLAPHQKQMATSIAQCGRNLIALVNDVLDYSKLDAGKLELAQTPFSLREMVQPVADSLGNIARQKGLAFHTRIAPEVPDTVCGDPLRLAQVLFNLLGNAVKFTERGEVALDISLHAGTTVFQVHDTGIGMTPAETANLFQAFWQAEQSTTRRFGGTGLGLSISRRLVEMMGGSFQVRSEKGVGSTFSFDLSLPLSSIPPPDPVPHRVSPGTSLRLLFADDNAVNQRVIERLLLKLGHQVTVVNNGAEAVAAFERDSFDAVLLDCHMPVEDGFSAARRMRIHERTQSRDSRTPILALTALAFAEDRDRCLQAGMDAHLTKPISLQQLDDALRAALPTHALPTHAPPAKNANSALTSQSTCTPSPPTAASS